MSHIHVREKPSARETPDARPTLRWTAAIFFVALLIYAPTTARGTVNNDVSSAALAGWRIATTGAPWLDGFDESRLDPPRKNLWIGEAKNGHVVINRSPGVVAAAVPLSWVLATGDQPEDFDLMAEALTAALLAAAAVALFFSAISRLTTRATATLSTLVLGLGTPMWSIAANSLWTHSVTVLGLLGMAWAASRERWWLVGLFGGIAVWGRVHTALIVAVVGLGIALSRRQPDVALKVGTISMSMLALSSVWTHWMYGSWAPTGGYAADAYLDAAAGSDSDVLAMLANHAGLWLSPDRGVLVWTPLLVLLFPAVIRSWRVLPDWSRYLLVGGVLYTLAQGQLNGFTGGSGFYGYRLGLELLVCAAPAYALSATAMGPLAKNLLGPLVGLQVGAILLGAISEGWFLHEYDAWTDNSLWLAIRHVPLVSLWVALMLMLGTFAGRVWMDRTAEQPTIPEPHEDGSLA